MEEITRAVEQAAGLEPIQRQDRELEGGAGGGFPGISFRASGKRTEVGADQTLLERWKIAIRALAEREQQTLLVIDEFQTLHLSDPSSMTELFRRQQSPLLGQAAKVDLPPLNLAFDINRLKGLKEATTRSPLPSLEEITSA